MNSHVMPLDALYAAFTGFFLALFLFVMWDLHHIMVLIDLWLS